MSLNSSQLARGALTDDGFGRARSHKVASRSHAEISDISTIATQRYSFCPSLYFGETTAGLIIYSVTLSALGLHALNLEFWRDTSLLLFIKKFSTKGRTELWGVTNNKSM